MIDKNLTLWQNLINTTITSLIAGIPLALIVLGIGYLMKKANKNKFLGKKLW